MKKILIVEDNKAISSLLKLRLEKEGFSVDVVEAGFAMLAYLKETKEPDGIVLDLFLPERSGIELLNSLVSKWNSARIFIYTAQSRWKSTCLRYPSVRRFFNKTQDMAELIEAVKKEI
ncbi:MAG: response regulator [Candidatus Omnitrophica bacterium]|nr:response regulator [Candidatus Omnitrophota bacterium]